MDQIKCPTCGELNDSKAKFCMNCGTKLEDLAKDLEKAEPVDDAAIQPDSEAADETEPAPAPLAPNSFTSAARLFHSAAVS